MGSGGDLPGVISFYSSTETLAAACHAVPPAHPARGADVATQWSRSLYRPGKVGVFSFPELNF